MKPATPEQARLRTRSAHPLLMLCIAVVAILAIVSLILHTLFETGLASAISNTITCAAAGLLGWIGKIYFRPWFEIENVVHPLGIGCRTCTIGYPRRCVCGGYVHFGKTGAACEKCLTWYENPEDELCEK